MTSKSLGMVGAVNSEGKLLGRFTDGDLRRGLGEEIDIYKSHASDLMSVDPFTVRPDTLAEEIVKTMRDYAQNGPHAINSMFVVDE